MKYPFLQTTTKEVGVKICGLRDELCIEVAVGAGADAIGFVFVPESPRYLERQQASQLLHHLPEDVLAVAVLQNYPDLEDFSDWNGWLQLSGMEDEATVASSPRPVIRAFAWSEQDVLRWDACDTVEALLVDGSTGGLGETFDTTLLAELIPELTKPIIIAGGLTPENVQEIIASTNPVAVDVSTGVEMSKGCKDPEKICAFINKVKELN